MKKIFISGVFLALVFVFSCTKDEFTEKNATQAQKDIISHQDSIDHARDSLNNIGGIIQYSVSVIPVDGSTGFVGGQKSAETIEMLAGATVSVSQHGVVLTKTTDESGIAVFHDLRVGTINVNVRATDYTTVNFIAQITPENDPGVNSYYDVLRHAATMVPVFSLGENTSTISGELTYETDLTNTEPEIASGVTVIAMLDVDNDDFKKNYFEDIWDESFGEYHAKIVQIAYADLVKSAVTDAAGAYSIEMPSAADGLPIKMEISDVAVDQQLLMNTVNNQPVHGVQTIRTIFNTNNVVSNIPFVRAAYVEFSVPTGVVTQQPIEDATATAIIGESGIASVIITNQGSGYTQPPKLTIVGDGEDAEVVAYISEGKVTSVEITNPGKGYSNASVIVESFVETPAAATPVISYGITGYNRVNGGDGYQSTPDVVITSSSGSGATAKALMSGYVSNIEVTNMGSGYVCPPNVIIERADGILATASAFMTEFNSIYSITLSENYIDNHLFETVPDVIIETPGAGLTGSGATAVVQLSNSGSIDNIILSNSGLGYAEAPTVLIVGGGGAGAVAEATLNTADGSISISILEKGSGYTSDPTIEISNPPAGGTAPVVDEVVRVFPISNITLTNPGSGYNIVYQENIGDEYTNEPTVSIDGNPINTDNDVTVRPDMKVDHINVTSGGNDYQTPPAVTITPKCGYGTDAAAVAEILFFVKEVEAVEGGSGYVDVNDIVVTIVTPPEGCLTQAVFSPALGGGVLNDVTIDEAGMGYLAPPSVYLRQNGNRIETLNATVANGAITGITFDEITELNDNANNYNIEFVTVEAGAAFGTHAYPQSGKISFIEIGNPGAGYTTVPQVKFIRLDGHGAVVETGSYIDAEAKAVVVDGRVTEITITNPGTGYYYAPRIEIKVPNELEIAKGIVEINDDGYITGVDVEDGGQGYSEAPTVTFYASVPGMGAGATGTAVIVDGSVSKVVMTNNGTGYLGKNTPVGNGIDITFIPTGSALHSFDVYAGKSYIKDIYLGTGKRTIEE